MRRNARYGRPGLVIQCEPPERVCWVSPAYVGLRPIYFAPRLPGGETLRNLGPSMRTDLVWVLGVLTLGLLSPGPDFFLVMRNSLGGSRARGLGTVAGIALGLAVQGIVIALGFATAPPAVLRVVQLAGAAFLGYLGIRSLVTPKPSRSARPAPAPAAEGTRAGLMAGLICNLTNAKAFLFFASVYSHMTRPGQPAFWRVALPAIVVVHAILCWTLITLALQAPPVASRLQRAQGILARAFGIALLALAGWIGWAALRG